MAQRNQSGVQDWDVLEVRRYQTTASTKTWNHDPAVPPTIQPVALPVVHFVGGNCIYYRNSKGWKFAEQDICNELGRYGARLGEVSFHHVPDPTLHQITAVLQDLRYARGVVVLLEDADFVVETAELTRQQILQQSATAALAQAQGVEREAVLALLG